MGLSRRLLVIYSLAFLSIAGSSVIFPYFYHDSAQTFQSHTCFSPLYFSAMGRMLHAHLLCLMNKLIPNVRYFPIYRLLGVALLAGVAYQSAKIWVASARDSAKVMILFLPVFVYSLPGSMLQVLHYQAIPFLIGLYAVVWASERYFSNPTPRSVFLFCTAIVLSCFIYQSSFQIVFSLLAGRLLFQTEDRFVKERKHLVQYLIYIGLSVLIYYGLHRFLFSHAYLFFDPKQFFDVNLDYHAGSLSFSLLGDPRFWRYVFIDNFSYSGFFWFPTHAMPGAYLAFFMLMLIALNAFIPYQGKMSFLKAGLLLACLYGSAMISSINSPNANTMIFQRCLWFQSALMVVLIFVSVNRVLRWRPVLAWFWLITLLSLLIYQAVFWFYARVYPNYREYQFIKTTLQQASIPLTKAKYVLIAKSRPAPPPQLQQPMEGKGSLIQDELYRTSTDYHLEFILKVALRDVLGNRLSAPLSDQVICYPDCAVDLQQAGPGEDEKKRFLKRISRSKNLIIIDFSER